MRKMYDKQTRDKIREEYQQSKDREGLAKKYYISYPTLWRIANKKSTYRED